MRCALSKRLAASLVLAWFVAFLGVAGLAPWVDTGPGDAVCTIGGVAPSSGQGGDAGPGHHTLKCALCLGISAPPSVPAVAEVAPQPLPHVLLPLESARLAALVGAPLPARGPPASS